MAPHPNTVKSALPARVPRGRDRGQALPRIGAARLERWTDFLTAEVSEAQTEAERQAVQSLLEHPESSLARIGANLPGGAKVMTPAEARYAKKIRRGVLVAMDGSTLYTAKQLRDSLKCNLPVLYVVLRDLVQEGVLETALLPKAGPGRKGKGYRRAST